MDECDPGFDDAAVKLLTERDLEEIVKAAFRGAVAQVQADVEVMSLSRWTESVFRFFFCRPVALARPDVEQFVECGKIDLVLHKPPNRAFIEFKFYSHPRRFDPYDGKLRGFKGGASKKNLDEFQDCVNQLHQRPYASGLSKYVALVYADPMDGQRMRYSDYLDAYRHDREVVALRLVDEHEAFRAGDSLVRGKLYEVTVSNTAVGDARV